MDGIPAIGDVTTILSLEFVCSLIDDLGDFVKTFPGRTKFAGSGVFGVLVNTTRHPISSLKGLSSNFIVVVLCHLLMVSYSPETSHVSQLIDGVEVMVESLPIGVLVKQLVP